MLERLQGWWGGGGCGGGSSWKPLYISRKMSNPLWQPEPDFPEGPKPWQGSHLSYVCQGGASGGVLLPVRGPLGQIWAVDGGGSWAASSSAGPSTAGHKLVKRSSFRAASRAAVAVRRVQTELLAASISHPLGSADTVNGPEIECKIKMLQINGCKSHLEPIIRTTSGL